VGRHAAWVARWVARDVRQSVLVWLVLLVPVRGRGRAGCQGARGMVWLGSGLSRVSHPLGWVKCSVPLGSPLTVQPNRWM